jgi:hypothetical protein
MVVELPHHWYFLLPALTVLALWCFGLGATSARCASAEYDELDISNEFTRAGAARSAGSLRNLLDVSEASLLRQFADLGRSGNFVIPPADWSRAAACSRC